MRTTDGPAACEALRRRIAQLERELAVSKSSSAFLESVLQAVPAYISNLDPDLNIRFLNRYQPGHTLESVLGRSVFDYMAEEDRAIVREQIDRARTTGQIVSYTLHRAAGPNGAAASYLTRVAPVREIDGRVGACLAFIDTTEEHRRERELRETQENLRLALEATGFGLWSWDIEADSVVWDERMLALHGGAGPVAPAVYAAQLVHPDDRVAVQSVVTQMLATGAGQQVPYRIVCPDGTIRWLLTVGRALFNPAGEAVKLLGGSLDATRQQNLEEQVRKGQRMDAVANLTAGVAHNFNNMLAVIIPILELATPQVSGPLQPMLKDGLHAASRAAELVRQLMAYAGQSNVPQRAKCEVAAMVRAAVSLCRHAFDARIELLVHTPALPTFVACDAGQIEQVLVNLILNAHDAVLANSATKGCVAVTVRTSRSASSATRQDVSIDVVDDGTGMSERVRARMFEPFFTTKPVGKGTGLGLATSYAVVRDHGGTLSCESTLGVGSRFTVSLPAVATYPSEKVPPSKASAIAGTHVLVVDDDDAVRRMLSAVLRSVGVHVHEANSCAAARSAIVSHPATEVVLLDRSMPDGPGESVIAELRALAPRARIVFLTGQIIEEGLASLVDAVLTKPTSSATLLRTIATVLQRD